MSIVGQKERATQNRVVKLFQDHLDYTYLGDWHEREDNTPLFLDSRYAVLLGGSQ